MHNETSVASANKLLQPMKLPVSWQPKKFSERWLSLFVFLQKVHTKTLSKINLIISHMLSNISTAEWFKFRCLDAFHQQYEFVSVHASR